MTVEAATFISGLNPLSPDGDTEYVYEGDNHITLLKSVLQNTINLTGQVVATYSEINLLSGFSYLGTAAARDAGSAAGDVCLLGTKDGIAALPAVDGSNLLNVQTVATTVADIKMEDILDGTFVAFHFANQ